MFSTKCVYMSLFLFDVTPFDSYRVSTFSASSSYVKTIVTCSLRGLRPEDLTSLKVKLLQEVHYLECFHCIFAYLIMHNFLFIFFAG